MRDFLPVSAARGFRGTSSVSYTHLDVYKRQVQAWLTGQGFAAALGEFCLIPGPDGIAAAVIGHGTPQTRARQRFALSKAATTLPAGAWALQLSLIHI